MGMYDTVMVPCPTCGKREDFQSKSGPCELRMYRLEEAPTDVLLGVHVRRDRFRCAKCGTLFGVAITAHARSVVVDEEEP